MKLTLTLAWRYLRGRGVRSLLTTLAVVFGVMLTFGLNGIMPTMVDAFTRNLLTSAGKVDLTVTSVSGEPFAATVADRLLDVPGIGVVSPGVTRIAPLPQEPNAPSGALAQVTVVGLDLTTASAIKEFTLGQGHMITPGATTSVVMNSDLAAQLNLGVGDDLVLPSAGGTTRFRVVGLLDAATVPGQEQVYVTLPAAQQLFGLGDRITQIEARFVPGADRASTEAAAAATLGPAYRVGGVSSESSLLASLGVASFGFTMFGVFALVTAGFIIANSFRTVIAERRRDIGMLRAVGATRRTVMAMFLAESLLQGILGTGLGLIAGWLMALGFFAAMRPIVDRFMHLELGGPQFAVSTWIMSIALGVGVTVLAALLPARSAGRVTPMEAMRPQLGEVYERRVGMRAWIGVGLMVVSLAGLFSGSSSLVGTGAVIFLIGVALLIPAVINPIAGWAARPLQAVFAREGNLARSNLQRNPGRSGATITAMMLGLGAIVATISMVTSIFAGFTSYLDKSLSADYLVIPQSIILTQGNVAAGPQLAAELKATPGIGPVSTLRLSKATTANGEVQVIGIDPASYLKVAAFDWNTGSSDTAVEQLAHGRWVIANGIYATQNNLTVGQPITLNTPNGVRTYYLAGIGNDYLNAKLATLYTSQDNLARDFNVTTDLLLMANRTPGADAVSTTAAVQKVVDGYPAFRLYESQAWRTEQLQTFNSSMVIFEVLIAALALPSLLALMNTLAISVLARTREIGMLRAVGATRRQIKRMVLAESLLLSIIGIVFGAIAGLWLGYAIVQAMAGVGWEMPYAFPWSGLLATVLIGLIFALLAALAPARSAAKLDVVAALHQE